MLHEKIEDSRRSSEREFTDRLEGNLQGRLAKVNADLETFVAETVKSSSEKTYNRSLADMNKVNGAMNKMVSESIQNVV